MSHNRTSKRRNSTSVERPPICDDRTYTVSALKACGVGPRMWTRLVKAGMPVDVVGNRILQRGSVVREWLARLAEATRREREASRLQEGDATVCRGGHEAPPAS